jgi:hypothetical protein
MWETYLDKQMMCYNKREQDIKCSVRTDWKVQTAKRSKKISRSGGTGTYKALKSKSGMRAGC